MKPLPTTWAPTGKSLPGCCAISRAREWFSCPGDWSGLQMKRSCVSLLPGASALCYNVCGKFRWKDEHRMDILYKSTRGGESGVTASRAVLEGLAGDGGLFVPERMPSLDVP